MIDLFVDSPVFLHALGAPVAVTPACQALIRSAQENTVRLHTAVECVQEIAFHRTRMGDVSRALAQINAIRDLCVVHPFDDRVLDRGLELMAATTIRGRDAFIAATALLAGFESIATTDARFVEVPGLRPAGPGSWTA